MEYMPWLQQRNSCCTYVQGKSERKKNNKPKTDKKKKEKRKENNNDNQINTYKHKLKVSNPQDRSHMFHVFIHIMKFVHA